MPSEFAPVLGLSSNSEPFTPPQFDNNTTNKELLNKFVKDGREWEEKGDLELMNIATTRYVRCSSLN